MEGLKGEKQRVENKEKDGWTDGQKGFWHLCCFYGQVGSCAVNVCECVGGDECLGVCSDSASL